MLKRAYSLLHVKSVDGDKRIITGTATTPTPDRMGDVVEPLGVQFKNPLPLLLYHNSQKPVGLVKFSKPTKAGIDFEASLPVVDEPGTVRDRIDEAWQSIKAGLLAGVSIGFRSIEEAYDRDTGGFHFLKTEVLELSLVAIPAQPDATIQTIKSLDVGLALSGEETAAVRAPKPAGVPAPSRVKTRTGHHMRKPYSEQIKGWVATRAEKSARMDAILEASDDTGVLLDDAQQEEHDALEVEVKGIDAQLVRLRAAEAREKDAAKQVAGGDTAEGGRARAGQTPTIHMVERKLQPGVQFARFVMAKAAVKAGYVERAGDYISNYFPDDHRLAEYTKTAVGAATTANAQGPLLQYNDIATEFIEYLRPLTILGKFGAPIPNGGGANYPDVTHVPFNVRVGTQTAGGTASWVGEGKAKPLTKGTFGTATLDFTKLACISVLTKEEVRFPSIDAQMKVRNDLTRAIAAQMDKDFIDPANLGTANVKPASITANIAATTATATTAVALAVNLKTMINLMIAGGIQPSSLVLIMSQAQALSLSLMRTSLGVRNYPDVTMMGGFLEGIPVITSEAVTSLGSPSTGMIVAVNANDVFLADDGSVTIATSDQASLEMSDAPAQDATTGGGASMVSMFQTNSLAILAERAVNWKLMRALAVQYIASPAYVPQ
ncbi:MAG: phage major capsid protein, partial [Vicinamibacterales bacterium]